MRSPSSGSLHTKTGDSPRDRALTLGGGGGSDCRNDGVADLAGRRSAAHVARLRTLVTDCCKGIYETRRRRLLALLLVPQRTAPDRPRPVTDAMAGYVRA